jgi:hypothetical protein
MQTDSRDLINLVQDWGDVTDKIVMFQRPIIGSTNFFQIKFRLDKHTCYMVIPEEFREIVESATLETCLQYSVETSYWHGFNMFYRYN